MRALTQAAAIIRRRRRGSRAILSDSFTRANGAIGAAETGQAYVQHVGAWTVAGNQANADATANAIMSAECNIADAMAQGDLFAGERFVAFRVVGATDFLLAGFHVASSLLRVFSCIGGAFTEIGAAVDVTLMTGTVRVRCKGTQVFVDFNGVQVRNEIIANFTTATRYGLYGASCVADNLKVFAN